MKAQIIEKNGHPEFAVISYEDYEHFLEPLEDETDARAVAEFHETTVPAGSFWCLTRLCAVSLLEISSIKLWRVHRALTQQELAKQVGISKPDICLKSKLVSARVQLRPFLQYPFTCRSTGCLNWTDSETGPPNLRFGYATR